MLVIPNEHGADKVYSVRNGSLVGTGEISLSVGHEYVVSQSCMIGPIGSLTNVISLKNVVKGTISGDHRFDNTGEYFFCATRFRRIDA